MPRSLNNPRQIIVMAHNIRSTYNVGSLFRTAEGLGLNELILTGYTPYPKAPKDQRLPYLANKLEKQIDKTALGAQKHLKWRYAEDILTVVNYYRQLGFTIYGLEQDPNSKKLPDLKAPDKVVIVVGNEVTGLEDNVRAICDSLIEIPMFGQKESFNVVQAAAMALYHYRFIDR